MRRGSQEAAAEEEEEEEEEEKELACWRAQPKHFFILSAAGKPIYSRHGSEAITSSYIGVIQAIISSFAASADTLLSFETAGHRFAVSASGPIYLAAVSSLGETATQLRAQLDALYGQVLSTLTLSQLQKVFGQRGNFDLRRLLGGTEVFLDGLVDAMARGSPPVLLAALECVRMRRAHRDRIHSLLLRTRAPGLLYGLIVADHRLVAVVRPRRHSLHPPDLQLLLSMLFDAATFRDGGEHWTPLCLPRFNSRGFLHAYIHFFRPDACVVLISADKDAFFAMRDMAATVVAGLGSAGLVAHIAAAASGRYAPTDIVPGTPIRHFLYKSRPNVQFTMPDWGRADRRRLMAVYHQLHAAVHTKHAHLKVCFSSRKHAEALAWVLPAFELYVVAAPGSKREAVVKGAQRLVQWVRAEEERLFVIGGATF